jgi:hypothetical protein
MLFWFLLVKLLKKKEKKKTKKKTEKSYGKSPTPICGTHLNLCDLQMLFTEIDWLVTQTGTDSSNCVSFKEFLIKPVTIFLK